MSLQQQLEELTRKLAGLVPAERLAIIDREIERLRITGADRALKAGHAAPAFALGDGDGIVWRSEDLLRNGPLVIVFYRGRWCAYCNTQLAALQEIHPRLTGLGGSLIALSPQTEKHTYMTRDMHRLGFPVLRDPANEVAGRFGLVWRLSPGLQQMYEGIMTRLPRYNGEDSWQLPLAATYIVRPNGVISFARVDLDWRQRGEPEEILEHITSGGKNPARRGRTDSGPAT